MGPILDLPSDSRSAGASSGVGGRTETNSLAGIAAQVIRPPALTPWRSEILLPVETQAVDPSHRQLFKPPDQPVTLREAQVVPAEQNLTRGRAIVDLTQALLKCV